MTEMHHSLTFYGDGKKTKVKKGRVETTKCFACVCVFVFVFVSVSVSVCVSHSLSVRLYLCV